MSITKFKIIGTGCAITFASAAICFAGQAKKWADLPEAVRAAVVANGGKEGQSVDQEIGKINGQDYYEGGKLKGHDGSWLLGKDTKKAGVILPAHPKLGDKFKSEDVSKDINENDEVVSTSETVVTAAGTYNDCVKVKEMLADGSVEYKYYAAGVGVVREKPSEGDVLLKSHTTK